MLRLDGGAAHYLVQVMRTRPGDPVKLFDDQTGEWLGIAREVQKRGLTLEITDHLRPRESVPDFWLVMAPIKKGRIDWMVEKACELGVARVVPVLTRRTVVDKLKHDRLAAHAVVSNIILYSSKGRRELFRTRAQRRQDDER